MISAAYLAYLAGAGSQAAPPSACLGLAALVLLLLPRPSPVPRGGGNSTTIALFGLPLLLQPSRFTCSLLQEGCPEHTTRPDPFLVAPDLLHIDSSISLFLCFPFAPGTSSLQPTPFLSLGCCLGWGTRKSKAERRDQKVIRDYPGRPFRLVLTPSKFVSAEASC